MAHYTIAAGGQSNWKGASGPSPWASPPAGCRYIDNGVNLSAYPNLVGPAPWILDELSAGGFDTADVCSWAINGQNLLGWLTGSWPSLVATWDLFGLPDPHAFVWLQGEADARIRDLAGIYRNRLIGPWEGGGSLFETVWERWPQTRILVCELRVRDPDYAPYHSRVRAAHHEAGDLRAPQRTRLVPTFDCELLPGDNQPHYSPAGLDTLGRRLATEVRAPGTV